MTFIEDFTQIMVVMAIAGVFLVWLYRKDGRK